MIRRDRTLLQQLDTTPLTFAVLLAWLTLAMLTDPMDPTLEQLIAHGASSGVLVQDGEPWRLITHAFLHGGLLHLLFNSYFLFWIGPQLEERVGSLRFALIFVVSAVGGGIAAVLTNPPFLGVVVGGSGAIFGMLGSAVALMMRQGRTQLEFLDYQGSKRLLGLIAINLVLGFLLPQISNAAHIGGLISGFVLTFMFLDRGRAGADLISRLAQAAWLALLAALLLFCIAPGTRWDYQLRMSHEASTAEARTMWRRAKGGLHPLDREALEGYLPRAYGDRGRDMLRRWVK